MGRQHVDHADIVRFAQDRVNLPKEKADEYRAQARRLRERLDSYLGENPDFTLKRMQLSGSLAKGTSLRSLNDIDVACYIGGADAPTDVRTLLDYLAERLRKAFPNFKPDQVQPQTYSVTVSFRGTGLDVDVVPILYAGDPDWYGKLVSQDDGSLLSTSVPRHIEFIRKRKAAQEKHFAQVARLVKFWGTEHEVRTRRLPLQIFHDRGDPRQALRQGARFFRLSRGAAALLHLSGAHGGAGADRLHRLLPSGCRRHVPGAGTHHRSGNAKNNVSKLYTAAEADKIVEAALDAGDAIDAALAAPTKGETVAYWQKVFGSSFQV